MFYLRCRQLPFLTGSRLFERAGHVCQLRHAAGMLQLVDGCFQGIQPLAHQRYQLIFGNQFTGGQILEQGFQRMAQIPQGEQAREACIALERVQVAHQTIDGSMGGEITFPLAVEFFELLADFPRFFEKDFQQLRIDIRFCQLGDRLDRDALLNRRLVDKLTFFRPGLRQQYGFWFLFRMLHHQR